MNLIRLFLLSNYQYYRLLLSLLPISSLKHQIPSPKSKSTILSLPRSLSFNSTCLALGEIKIELITGPSILSLVIT